MCFNVICFVSICIVQHLQLKSVSCIVRVPDMQGPQFIIYVCVKRCYTLCFRK